MKNINMKKISVLIFVAFLSSIVSGQQLPQVTQYMINNYAINPAVSSMYDYYQLKTTVRNQWVGMPDAPTTTLLSIYGKRNENVGLGALLFNDQTGVTGSVANPQLLGYTVKTFDPDYAPDSVNIESSGTLAQHYFAHGAYNFEFNPYFSLEPSFLVKHIAGLTQIDFGMKAIYDDMLWGGINYRNNGDLAGLVGYSFQDRYEIGYAYEMVNSELKVFAPVTHEFVVGIKFKPATEEEILFYK